MTKPTINITKPATQNEIDLNYACKSLRRDITKLKKQLSTKRPTVYWSWEEKKLDPIEFIRRIRPMICEPMNQARECDGDLYLSEYRKLNDASYHLNNVFDDD